MLVDLKVKNFVLIAEQEISFKEGLNVLTGETGAGKSIIVGALDMLLGSRASSEVIRRNQDVTYIEAIYEPSNLKKINQILLESGIEPDPEVLLLSREIKRNGRNRSRINGQLATLNMIKNISRYLIDIHGQHEHQLLLNSAEHLNLLDGFIGQKIIQLKQDIKEKYNQLKKIDGEIAELQGDEGQKARQLDLLNYQIKEIERANLKPAELKKLKKEFRILSNMEEIYSITGEICNRLNDDDLNQETLLAATGKMMKNMDNIKDYDSLLTDFYQQLQDNFFQLQDLSFEFENYHRELEFNDRRLSEIEERLDLIQSLQKKYGKTIKDILDYQENLIQKKEKLLGIEQRLIKLKNNKKKIMEEYNDQAQKLSQIRKKAACKLEKLILKEFKDLALKETIFKVNFNDKQPGITGIDGIEFLIATNPGEDLKPLAQIVSGGELSRIMLALKTIIAAIDQVDTLIFDEVDSGIGGKTAQLMAEKLARIGRQRQTICITHLPQIASMSDNHYFITKKTKNNKTFTAIKELNREQRKRELARMLGGVKTTTKTLEHAEEMLTMAEAKK